MIWRSGLATLIVLFGSKAIGSGHVQQSGAPLYGVYGLCKMGNTLFFQGPEGVISYDVETHVRKELPPVRKPMPNGELHRVLLNNGPQRLILQSGYLWTIGMNFILRYELKTNGMQVVHQIAPAYCVGNSSVLGLLGVSGAGTLWLYDRTWRSDKRQMVFRVMRNGLMIEVPLEVPISERPEPVVSRGGINGRIVEQVFPWEPQPVAMMFVPGGEIVWCKLRKRIAGKDIRGISGYYSKTKKWTAFLPTTCWRIEASCFKEFGSSVYVSAHDEVADVYRYDFTNDSWSVIARPRSPDPIGKGYGDLIAIASADASEIWCVDLNTLALCKFDLLSKSWSRFPCPEPRRGDGHDDNTVRSGNTFYVASDRGVWRYEILSNRWRKVYPN